MTGEIALVTDSTADLPPEVVRQYGIEVIPNRIILGGEMLEDGVSLSRAEFYRRLPELKELPTTGTAPTGVYEEAYRRSLQKGAQAVLSIHASSQLSGIINAAHSAAVNFGGSVQVLDSQSLTMGLGFQVLTAAEAIRAGLRLEAVIEKVEAARSRAQVIAMLDTLEYVGRSGRVSWARARLGNLLQIKPFVEVREGLVHSIGESRTRSKGLARLIELVLKRAPLERLAILHTNAEAEARQFLQDLEAAYRPLFGSLPAPTPIVNVTTIIGTHVGPKALGIAALLARIQNV